MSHIHFAPQCGPLCSWSSGSSGSVNNRVNFRETGRRATLSLTLGPIFSNLPSSHLFSITRTSPPAATSCTWIQIVGVAISSSSLDRYGRAGDLPEKSASCDCQNPASCCPTGDDHLALGKYACSRTFEKIHATRVDMAPQLATDWVTFT